MEVTLTPELEDLIARQVDEGNYPSAGEVVREALRLLKEQVDSRSRQLDALQREVAAGIQDLEQGAYETYDNDNLEGLIRSIKAKGRSRGPSGANG